VLTVMSRGSNEKLESRNRDSQYQQQAYQNVPQFFPKPKQSFAFEVFSKAVV
jgi:hypothetical protein